MSLTLETWDDKDVPGLSISFTSQLVKIIHGATEYHCGPPIEPDENIYEYKVEKIEVYGAPVNLEKIGVTETYEDECDMVEDVSIKVYEKLLQTMR